MYHDEWQFWKLSSFGFRWTIGHLLSYVAYRLYTLVACIIEGGTWSIRLCTKVDPIKC